MTTQLELADLIRSHCGDLFKNPTLGPDKVAALVIQSTSMRRLQMPEQRAVSTETPEPATA